MQKAAPEFVQEYDCRIRERLGVLVFGSDQWFEITDDPLTLGNTIVDLLKEFGLPFLGQFESYGDVLDYYHQHGILPSSNEMRASLDAALVARHIGQEELAAKLFAKAYQADHPGFREYVAEIGTRLGYVFDDQTWRAGRVN